MKNVKCVIVIHFCPELNEGFSSKIAVRYQKVTRLRDAQILEQIFEF
jgi:hypothetical protein